MKTLPNGVMVFNATPHTIRFWSPNWEEPVEVETDQVISASVREVQVYLADKPEDIDLVCPTFDGTAEGRQIAVNALANGAHFVVGSFIAAQAYPDLVVAMVAAEGYERVPPAEKRMRPDKFTTFWEE